MAEPSFLRLRLLLGRHLPFQRLPQAILHVVRDALRLHAFVDLKGLLCRVDDHEAVGTFGNVRLETPLHVRVAVRVQVVVQFLEELFTSKQRRLPLFA